MKERKKKPREITSRLEGFSFVSIYSIITTAASLVYAGMYSIVYTSRKSRILAKRTSLEQWLCKKTHPDSTISTTKNREKIIIIIVLKKITKK